MSLRRLLVAAVLIGGALPILALDLITSVGQLPPAQSKSVKGGLEGAPVGTGATTPPRWRSYPNQ
jgi:hypothetical protein